MIQHRITRKGLERRFPDIREFWGSYMTKYLSEAEINFLQGRVSSSIFMRHYFNPTLLNDLRVRALKGIQSLS